METMERRQPRARRSFTPEFKAEIVQLCRRGDRLIGRVARDVDLTKTALRGWVRQAERDAGTRGDGGLTPAERQALSACAGSTNGCAGCGDPQASDGVLRDRDPVNVDRCIKRRRRSGAPSSGRASCRGLPGRRRCAPCRRPGGTPARRRGAHRAHPPSHQASHGPLRPTTLHAELRRHRASARLQAGGRAAAGRCGRRPRRSKPTTIPGPAARADWWVATSASTPPRSPPVGVATSPASRPGKAGCSWPP
jgi:transposase